MYMYKHYENVGFYLPSGLALTMSQISKVSETLIKILK